MATTYGEKKAEKKAEAPVASKAQADATSATLRKVVTFLEQMFNFDINGDGRVGGVRIAWLVVLAMLTLTAFAANELVWSVVPDVAYVDAEGDATFNSVTADVTGDVTGDVSGDISMSVTTANWTDGSTNTVAPGVHLIKGTGGANDTTNTVVLANPAAAGDLVTIIMAAGTTNLITIADSGNVAATGAILLDANDSVTLTAATTALWVETSSTDN